MFGHDLKKKNRRSGVGRDNLVIFYSGELKRVTSVVSAAKRRKFKWVVLLVSEAAYGSAVVIRA
jgi:hypothetical protein